MQESQPRNRLAAFTTGAVFVAASALYLYFVRRTSFWAFSDTFYSLFDDAMISMRYAKNLALGFGLVWNPGEAPIEGYTNFLWTLWMALLHLLPVSESKVSLTVMLSGVVLLLANLFVVSILAKKILSRQDPWYRLIPIVLVAFFYPLIYWTLRGMEVGLVVFLLSCGTHFCFLLEEKFERKTCLALSAVLALSCLTRPDTVIYCALLGGYALWRSEKNRLAVILWVALPAAVIVAGHLIFRYSYYGEWLPNTYYLKVVGASLASRMTRGWSVFYDCIHQGLYVALFALFFVLNRNAFQPRPLLLLSIFVSQCLYSIYVGGDAWEMFGFTNRFITVGMPSLFLFLAVQLPTLARTRFVRPGIPAGVLATVTILFLTLLNGKYFLRWKQNNAEQWMDDVSNTKFGLHVRYHTQTDAKIAVVCAGAIAYFADRLAIDLLGKNDAYIANTLPRPNDVPPGHTKWDYDYSIGSLQPDLITRIWEATPSDRKMIAKLGYIENHNGIWTHKDSPRIRTGIEQDFWNTTLWVGSAN